MHVVFATSVTWYDSRQPVAGLRYFVHRTDIPTGERICRFLHMPIICESHFHTIQRDHLFPTVHTMYSRHKDAIIAAFGDDELTHVGDGRCDSPGFCANFGTYSLMEEHTGAILTFKVTYVGESASSPSMEPDGCDCAIRDLLAYGVNIGVIGTDRSITVEALLSKTYPMITHQFDVYHVEKNLRIKLSKKACERGGFEIYAWIKAIINHLWYSCQNCDRDPDILREKWSSLIYHITNQHDWNFCRHFHQCDHPPLVEDGQRKKRWLTPDSPAHAKLKHILLDPPSSLPQTN